MLISPYRTISHTKRFLEGRNNGVGQQLLKRSEGISTPEELEELNKASGAAKEDLSRLQSQYPNCPESSR
jgi:hypothetical protein